MRYLFAVLILISVFASCKKEDFDKGNVELQFSADTIIFDTVFTTIGSATEVLVVYNPSDKDVQISSLRIASGQNSNFRLNVDGVAGKTFENVEIASHDSIFIFAEVTVDPNNVNSPMVISDSILFITNGEMQDVDLVAWGQDAVIHRPPANSQINPYFLINCNDEWTSIKPHVIYGYAMVDSACTLTIDEGAKIYSHPGSGLIVLTSGTLKVNGTLANPVTFQGDRLDYNYKDVPGQWDRIWLSNFSYDKIVRIAHNESLDGIPPSPGAKHCSINYAIIKNGEIGLLVDTSFNDQPGTITLDLENTIIKNMTSNAVALRGANVNAFNCVFANCGAQTANMLFGGNYNFYHCTFANFWENGPRQDPAVSMNNYFATDAGVFVRQINSYFGNCIIYGTNDNEIGYDSVPVNNQFNFRFDHTLIRAENTFPTSDASRYIAILKATDASVNNPLFVNTGDNDFRPDSASSPVVNAGDINITNMFPVLLNDITGMSRLVPPAPDLGAYERR